MQMNYSWIDSPLVIDVIGDDLWSLLRSTAQDEAILGFSDEADSADKSVYLNNLKHILKGRGHLLVGSIEGQIIVTCLLIQQSLQTTNHLAELQKGVIANAYRGKGYLEEALQRIVIKSKEIGVSRLTLDVREGTVAHKLWSYWGFESFGVLDDYARHNGKSYRGHFMHQSVDDLERKLSCPKYSKEKTFSNVKSS
ncbi:GNAT family N-acetyltransferase [Marinobacter sp. GN3S48]|uniref:GNAT family N-acetyltransferase n=1 Tax=Marinobacter sp. GN3S48 TaxID=3382302 RepID=UPI00387B4E8C